MTFDALLKSCKDYGSSALEALFHLSPIICTFFAPAKLIAILVVIILLVDTYLGVKASKAKKIPFSSNRFSDFFAKLIGYFVFLTVGLLLNNITGWPYWVWLSSIIPIYTEIVSIDENQRALGKKGILKQAEGVYKFAVNIKKKRDALR